MRASTKTSTSNQRLHKYKFIEKEGASSIVAIVPSAGLGKRMQSDKPKQFLTLNNKPIFIVTLKALSESGLISKFIIPAIDLIYTRRMIKAHVPDLNTQVIKGGKTRQESIYNGLQEIVSAGKLPELILIHDAVRALIQESTIKKVVDSLVKKNDGQIAGAIAATPVIDTLKLADSGQNIGKHTKIKKNISRDHMWQAQTPQVFKTKVLIEAYKQARADKFEGTDSAVLLERLGYEVLLIESPKSNFKITTPEDLELAKCVLALYN